MIPHAMSKNKRARSSCAVPVIGISLILFMSLTGVIVLQEVVKLMLILPE